MAISDRIEAHGMALKGHELIRPLLFALLTVALMSLLLTVSLLPLSPGFREGDVASTDIRAPRKLTYVSQVLTRAQMEQAAQSVPFQTALDLDLVFRQRAGLNALLQSISAIRNNPSLNRDQRLLQIKVAVDPPFDDPAAGRLAGIDGSRWLAVATESQLLLQDVMKDKLSEAYVGEVRLGLPARAGDHLSEVERGLAVNLASRFIRSNVKLDEEATARLRREAQEAVATVRVSLEKDEVIIRSGQVITPVDLEKLELLGMSDPRSDWRGLASAALLSLVVVGCVGAYIYRFQPELLRRERRLAMIGLLMVLTVVAAKIVLTNRPLWAYVFPLPAVAMLLTTLLSARLSLLVSLLLAVIVGYVAGGSLEIAAMLMASSSVAAIGVWRRERLLAFFGVGLLAGLAQLAVVTAFFLSAQSDDLQFLAITAVEAGINGVGSAVIAVGLSYLMGRVFGITTVMQLLELANPTQPLLRRLLLEAPGTYHHSIMVGNLAERAAEEIGADSLLVRVGAYYHDIGKLKQPYWFVENQAGGPNIHESLEPQQSAQLIGSHVSNGIELAKQYGLPVRIQEMIPQHHGTRLVSFFYQHATERSVNEVDRAAFCYPGPKPQSKEAAILMLADGAEAAARAADDHSPEAVEALVERIVADRLSEGQFDECDLSLKDLQRIRAAFGALLTGIYHPRIEYPEPVASPAHVAS